MLPGKVNAMKNCSRSNEGLATMPDEISVQFNAFLSHFDRTQGRACGRKAGRLSTDLKCHLDPAAWVLPGMINAMENCARCDWGLTTLSGEVNLRFIANSASLTARKAVFVVEKRVD